MTLFATTRRALALLPSIFAAAMPAAAQDSAESGWRNIHLYETAFEETGLLRRAQAVGALAPWVSATDFPADMPTGNGSGYVRLLISIDADDRITDCQAETSPKLAPHLGNWACERIRQRGKFRHALSLDGKPANGVVTMTMVFDLASAPLPMIPPAPPAPPYGWIETYQPNLKLVDLPEQAMRGPASLTGSTIVSPSLSQRPDGTFFPLYCGAVRSSGNADIDKASCDLAKSASYSFVTPGRRYGSMQMRVHWKKGRAKIDYPDRDRITPLTFSVEPGLGVPAGMTFSEVGFFAFTFGPGRRVDCRVRRSTGSDALDVATCRDGAKRVRFTPQVNLFGEEVPTETVYQLLPSDGTLHRLR